jgi:hypothetical protein
MSISEREDLSAILGHFGPYGGRFVPEALIGALEELEEAIAPRNLTRRLYLNLPNCTAHTPVAPALSLKLSALQNTQVAPA